MLRGDTSNHCFDIKQNNNNECFNKHFSTILREKKDTIIEKLTVRDKNY